MRLTDYLLNCKQLNFHSGCPDGIIARNILLKALHNSADLDVVPRQAGTKNSIVHPAIFVDMSPAEDQFLEVLQNGGVIMDHHSTVKHLFDKYMEEFPDQLMWGENDKAGSGAWLAWLAVSGIAQERNLPCTRQMQNAAHLASLGDTWQKDHKQFDLARAFANLVDLVGNDYNGLYEELELAQLLWASKKKAFARSAEKAIWRDICGKRVAFTNSLKTSDVAELLRGLGANIIVGYAELFDVDRKQEWVGFSLRSDESFNCAAFAKLHGGGGHPPAAGFGQPLKDVHSASGSALEWVEKELKSYLAPDNGHPDTDIFGWGI